ncbi:UNVERIFIED_ORG: hypothetical protein E4P37_01185 [Bacillus sp. AZ43]
MSQPPYPTTDGPAPYQPAGAPSWAPAWEAPVTGPGPVAQAPRPSRPSGPLVLGLAAAGAGLLGVLAGGLVVTALFAGNADEFGQVVGEAMAPSLEESITDGLAESTERSMDELMALLEEGVLSQQYAASGPVEQYPATEPADLGEDSELDPYAQSCFEGDLQACDELYYRSPPLSAYETYASTCGGRVKPFLVPTCTELE